MFNAKNTALALALVGTALTSSAVAGEEGGYAGTYNQGHSTVVYNFLRWFSYDQYYWSKDFCWENSNDYYVDNMDIAVFAGHGSPWYFVGTDNRGVDLRYVGNGYSDGYGDDDCEFVAFQSCKVVPSPIESSSWAYNWTRSSGVFDGLHQAMGFRTNSYQSTDQDVTNRWGMYVRYGYGVWQSWFWAIDAEAYSSEHGSAVMHPTTQNDTYYNFVNDPSSSSSWLTVWYQH